ncbi:hypothetical protein Caka_0885 [Coraliomargarita akajimensis DSM 45221]|uniref:Uncharacterized protein n=1 Tax=Coraliomargarita akajimensis (strain DSM 45221 / IAM 15411 / JCM 23193 / KCTC 12865 / 04OKA010-24) TaxID=583355 RepID=D5EQD9_CORAD|nr:hypothetical protein Caka_0885 [Coraliomargarita akajimensis DSM 45221]
MERLAELVEGRPKQKSSPQKRKVTFQAFTPANNEQVSGTLAQMKKNATR